MGHAPNEDASGRTVLRRDEPTSVLGRIDAGVYVIEKAIVTFSLLAMAGTYFLDILHVEMAAKDNAFVRLVYRLSGYSGFERPPESLQEAARTWIAPLILGVGSLLLSFYAVYTADRERRKFGALVRVGLSVLITAAFYGFARLVQEVPSNLFSMGIYVIVVAAYGRIAWVRGRAAVFVLGWLPASVPILYVLHGVSPGYSWAQDVAKVLIMWVGFVGASMATRDHKHIRIDFVRKAVPAERRPLYNGISHLVTVAFCLVLLVLASAYLLDRLEMGARLASIDLGVWLLVLPIPLSLLIMVLRFTGRMVTAFRGGEAELSGGAH